MTSLSTGNQNDDAFSSRPIVWFLRNDETNAMWILPPAARALAGG
jgi:hypothetical protein